LGEFDSNPQPWEDLVSFAIGILAAVAGVVVLFLVFRKAEPSSTELVELSPEVAAAARHFGVHLRADKHPVDCLEDSEIAVAAISLAFVELGGIPRPGQSEALSRSLQTTLGLASQRAEEALILGRWLVAECGGPVIAMDLLTRRLKALSADAGHEPLMKVLSEVTQAGGNLTSGRQQDAVAAITRSLAPV